LSELTDPGEGDSQDDVPLSDILVTKQEPEEVPATSISAMTAAQLKLEQKRQKHRDRERERRRRKKLEAMKLESTGNKANNARMTRAKQKENVARVKGGTAMKSAESSRKRTRSSGIGKRKRAGKVIWSEMYMGDEKDEFYRKVRLLVCFPVD
jgi:hypothetical protein